MLTKSETKDLLSRVSPLIPNDWFSVAPDLVADDDEILIIGTLTAQSPGGADPSAFREATRKERMRIAQRLEAATQRSIAWGVVAGGSITIFTSLGVPVMTRLRVTEREVLDTLVASGVAKSRSDALSWCVRFVGQKEAGWLGELRATLEGVSKVRAEGPTLS